MNETWKRQRINYRLINNSGGGGGGGGRGGGDIVSQTDAPDLLASLSNGVARVIFLCQMEAIDFLRTFECASRHVFLAPQQFIPFSPPANHLKLKSSSPYCQPFFHPFDWSFTTHKILFWDNISTKPTWRLHSLLPPEKNKFPFDQKTTFCEKKHIKHNSDFNVNICCCFFRLKVSKKQQILTLSKA